MTQCWWLLYSDITWLFHSVRMVWGDFWWLSHQGTDQSWSCWASNRTGPNCSILLRENECLFCHPNNFVHFCFMPMDISSVHFLIDSENFSCSDVKLLLKTRVKLTYYPGHSFKSMITQSSLLLFQKLQERTQLVLCFYNSNIIMTTIIVYTKFL